MKNLLVFRIIGIIVATSLLAACGQASQPTTNTAPPAVSAPAAIMPESPNPTPAIPNAKGPDACTFLTKEDVSQVLGVTVDAGTLTGLGGVCTYTTKDASIDLTVTHTGGAKYLEGIKATVGDTIFVVTGVGDEAYYNTNSSTLVFRKGDAAYLISYADLSHSLTDEDKQAKQKALAVQMLTHLP
jgi:hypothetical protein